MVESLPVQHYRCCAERWVAAHHVDQLHQGVKCKLPDILANNLDCSDIADIVREHGKRQPLFHEERGRVGMLVVAPGGIVQNAQNLRCHCLSLEIFLDRRDILESCKEVVSNAGV